MILTHERLGELCTWALSVADGIAGGRWHTDGQVSGRVPGAHWGTGP